MKKQIIIMAKSEKYDSHYCIAGIDCDTNKWIRPVSSDISTERAIPIEHLIYTDGTEVEVLDIVEIEFTNPIPTTAQQENYAYNETIPWRKVGGISLDELIHTYGTDNEQFVFENNNKSLLPNEVSGKSLLFLKISDPCVVIATYEKKKYTLNFTYNGYRYNYVPIGDLKVKEQYLYSNNGYYDLNRDLYVVFSLTGLHRDEKHYKMVAQLFY